MIAVVVETRNPGRIGRARVSEGDRREEAGGEECRDETTNEHRTPRPRGGHGLAAGKSDASGRTPVFWGLGRLDRPMSRAWTGKYLFFFSRIYSMGADVGYGL